LICAAALTKYAKMQRAEPPLSLSGGVLSVRYFDDATN
jgi:hypothetical protein